MLNWPDCWAWYRRHCAFKLARSRTRRKNSGGGGGSELLNGSFSRRCSYGWIVWNLCYDRRQRTFSAQNLFSYLKSTTLCDNCLKLVINWNLARRPSVCQLADIINWESRWLTWWRNAISWWGVRSWWSPLSLVVTMTVIVHSSSKS